MVNKEIRSELEQMENVIIFDNPAYDNSIIGISDDDRVVYSYDSMVRELAEEDGIGLEDAEDFVSYNTIRALSYISDKNKPIVVYELHNS